jgi:hypothetical protein
MLTRDEQATNAATWEHIHRVRHFLNICQLSLMVRGEEHDQSKLKPPEVAVFTECTERLKDLTYGSDEYKACLKEMKPALDHHYAHNSHHPEFYQHWECPTCRKLFWPGSVPKIDYPDSDFRWCDDCHSGRYPGFFETALIHRPASVKHMDLLDVLEMLCDWKAATERHADGDILKSIDINVERFGLSEQLADILRNTVAYFEEVTSD